MPNPTERETLWKALVCCYAEALHQHVGLAVTHGWLGDQKGYELGAEIRTRLGLPTDSTTLRDMGTELRSIGLDVWLEKHGGGDE